MLNTFFIYFKMDVGEMGLAAVFTQHPILNYRAIHYIFYHLCVFLSHVNPRDAHTFDYLSMTHVLNCAFFPRVISRTAMRKMCVKHCLGR